MSLRHLEFLFQEAFTGIRRNAFMSIAAVSTIAVSLLLLGALRLASVNLDHIAAMLSDRFEVRVFLRMQVTEEQREELGKKIAALPGVSESRLVTKEEAWPEMCRRLDGMIDLSDLQGSNPLPDSFVVRVGELDKMGSVAERIRQMQGVDEVTDTHEAAERVASLTRAIEWGGIAAVALLIAAAAIIVGNTIRLTVHVRRVEIGIMQLVGATNGCIRAPFLLEGAFHGVAGALVALVLLATGYSYLHGEIRNVVPFLELLPPSGDLILAQASIVVGTGLGLGLISSYLSVRRYLRS